MRARVIGSLVAAVAIWGSLAAAVALETMPAPLAEEVVVAAEPALDVPVVLVPGWFDTGRDLAALRIRLLGAGLPESHVLTLTFADPTGSNLDHAEELDSAIVQLMAQTGADRVDVVAHSMGGLAARWYLNTHPDAPVRRIAFLGTPHQGTLSAHLAWGDGRDEMLPDSPFLEALNAQAALPDGVEAITVRTPIDTHVLPGESAMLPGVPDHVVCCPTHPGLLDDGDVFLIVLDFLERTGTPVPAAASR